MSETHRGVPDLTQTNKFLAFNANEIIVRIQKLVLK